MTQREAELAATRLASGALASAIEQAAELLTAGKRRVRDLGGVEGFATDQMLAPLRMSPGAAEILGAVADRDPAGGLTALADALAPDPLSFEARLLVKHADYTLEEARLPGRTSTSASAAFTCEGASTADASIRRSPAPASAPCRSPRGSPARSGGFAGQPPTRRPFSRLAAERTSTRLTSPLAF